MIRSYIYKLKYSDGIKTTLAVFFGQLITQGISFLTTPIFTRLMSVEEYGIITQYNACNAIITVLATLMLSGGVFQVAMNEFPNERNSFTYSAIILSNIATVIVFLFIFISIDSFSHILSLPISLIVLLFFYNLLNPVIQLWMCKQRYEYKYKKIFIISVVSAVIGQLIAVLALLKIDGINKGVLKLWSSTIPTLVFSIILYFSIGIKERFMPVKKYMTYAFIFNMPLLPHYLAQYALVSCNQIFITYYLGTDATAIYGLASTIAYMSNVVWSALSASLTPYIYENLNIKNYKNINSSVVGILGLYGVCCVCVSIVGPEVLFILGSNKYTESLYLIPPICATGLLQAVYSTYSTIAFYNHKRVATAVMTIIAAIVNVILDIMLIPKHGCIGAAYATELSYLMYVLLHYVNYRWIVKKERIFSDASIWCIVIAVTILCFVMGSLYDYLIMRYGIITILLLLCIVFRKKWFHLIKL